MKNTQKRFIKMLKNVNGTTFIGIDAAIPVKLAGGQKNEFQGRVTEVLSHVSVMVSTNRNGNTYANMVNKRLKEEGKRKVFKLSNRSWGTRVWGTPLITHKDNLYLQAIFLRKPTPTFLVDGKPVDASEIPGIPERKLGGKQGGLKNKVGIRTLNIEHITAIRMGGVEYKLR